MNKVSPDAGIPLLTEVIGPDTAPQSAANAPSSINRPLQKEAPRNAQTAPSEPRIEGEWSNLEHEISERVLQQMLGRIDFVLEQRVRDSLADVLQTAVESLAIEIRQGLQQTLEEVISRAVSQEIIKLQTTKN